MTRPKLPETKVNIPMPEVKPPKEDFMTEFFIELYLEKCKKVYELEKKIRELAAEPLKGFIPNVEPPEALPECLLGETVTAQDILCLSSALRNLHEIHKCDSFTLYRKLSRVLEQKIDAYCKTED